MTTIYSTRISKYRDQVKQLHKLSSTWSWIRVILLVITLVFFYHSIRNTNYLIPSLFSSIAFLFAVRRQIAYREQENFAKELLNINLKEQEFVTHNYYPFPDGTSYQYPQHPFLYDLDVLGDHSLFQYLNRCQTPSGGHTLANRLLDNSVVEDILDRQFAVKDLVSKLDFRQKFQGKAHQAQLEEHDIDFIQKWADQKKKPISKFWVVIIWSLPIVFIGLLITQAIWSPFSNYWSIIKWLGGLNLLITAYFLKPIKNEILEGDQMGDKLQSLGDLLHMIEQETFTSKIFQGYQQTLKSQGKSYADSIKQLGKLLGKLDSIQNPIGAIISNGLLLYHSHILLDIQKWKSQHLIHIKPVINIIGEIEMYISLANYAYNNPENTYPSISASNIDLHEARHPLMRAESSVANSLSFAHTRFFILTGSNMSGKSTFLRTVGLLQILGKTGAPIPAAQSIIADIPLYASMRISDSLSDSQSYFYAELHKLQSIMQDAMSQDALILLDEILRGTNSDDKRYGTIEVIHKLMKTKAKGIVATHDLEVCNTVNDYPDSMDNICFESQITSDELHFDYHLRHGICQNRNASFLMKKMGVIDGQ